MLKFSDSGIYRSSVFLIGFLVLSQIPNHPPNVKFIQPPEKTNYSWNQLVPYSVEVSDLEDGESRFQEIQSAEVWVKLKYVENRQKESEYLRQKKFPDSVGINNMVKSNCFNCHSVKLKLAGPSFLEISKRYPNTYKNQDLIVSHILLGSKGIWGTEVMPTHPELSAAAAREMVKWILNYAGDPSLNYLVGLQGSLPLSKPGGSFHQGLFIVEAYYTDHGSAENPGKKLTGFARTVIQVK
jgi:cytochrome c